jgi:hypothetical protein
VEGIFMKWLLNGLWILMSFVGGFSALFAEELLLKENLQYAQPGDYIVTSSYKTQTLLHIYSKRNHVLTIEEIAFPERRRPSKLSWQEWVNQKAPGHTQWVRYEIDLATGQMLSYYSFTKNKWFDIPEADNFLSKLLNLRFIRVPDHARKKIGLKPAFGRDTRHAWQPRMIVEGRVIPNVQFDAWRTKWPRDGSDLSGKTMDVYIPAQNQRYPSYFPYWLQIQEGVGKARIRIVDSGCQLQSPKPPLFAPSRQMQFPGGGQFPFRPMITPYSSG